MMPRASYEMSKADLAKILDACKPVSMIMLQCGTPRSPQENANSAWARLGEELGFDSMTVRPIQGKGQRFFTAVPNETDAARDERLEIEAEEKRVAEISKLEAEIDDRRVLLKELAREAQQKDP